MLVIISIFYTFVVVNIILVIKMKALFEAIQALFVDFLFLPLDGLRWLELRSWWSANIISWIFIGIGAYYFVYWCKQIKLHKQNNDEYQDTTAHSFLK